MLGASYALYICVHGMLLATHAHIVPLHGLVYFLLCNTLHYSNMRTTPLHGMDIALHYLHLSTGCRYSSCTCKMRTMRFLRMRLVSHLQAALARFKRRPYATLGHRPIGQPANFSDKASTYPQSVVFLPLARPIPY